MNYIYYFNFNKLNFFKQADENIIMNQYNSVINIFLILYVKINYLQ